MNSFCKIVNSEGLTIEHVRDIAKRYDLVIQQKQSKKISYNVFRIVNQRPVFQGRRSKFSDLVAYINRLIRIVDYENSKIEC